MPVKKVMIVGCGAIAPEHIAGYLKFLEKAEIKFLADSDEARANELIKRFGLSAVWVPDYREALAESDVVSVCTPPATHCEIAVAALEQGCHVLLEKPMALSISECDKILLAAKSSGRLISVVAQSRFISQTRNVADIIKSGSYGRCHYTRVNSFWYRGQSYYSLFWRGRWESEGGGCTLNHSIHHIDILNWIKGRPEYISAFMANVNHKNSEEEDFSSSCLSYGDGSVAEITSTLLGHGERQSFEFYTERAGITIPFSVKCSTPRENGFPMEDAEGINRVTEDYTSRGELAFQHHTGQIENFLSAIEGEAALVSSGEDGRLSIEVITGIYKSAILGQRVKLPIEEGDPFYTADWHKKAPHFNEKQHDVKGFADKSITILTGKG